MTERAHLFSPWWTVAAQSPVDEMIRLCAGLVGGARSMSDASHGHRIGSHSRWTCQRDSSPNSTIFQLLHVCTFTFFRHDSRWSLHFLRTLFIVMSIIAKDRNQFTIKVLLFRQLQTHIHLWNFTGITNSSVNLRKHHLRSAKHTAQDFIQ